MLRGSISRLSSTSVGRPQVACMPCEFVISDIQWARAADLQCPIHELTASMCASPTPSGAPWSVRSTLNTPSLHGDPDFPRRSGTWWSRMPVPCWEWRSPGRRCATQRVAFQTGSAGGWLEPFGLPRLAGASPADSSRGDARALATANAPAQPRSAGGAVEAAGAVDGEPRSPTSKRRPQAPWTPANGRRRPQLPQPASAGPRTYNPSRPHLSLAPFWSEEWGPPHWPFGSLRFPRQASSIGPKPAERGSKA